MSRMNLALLGLLLATAPACDRVGGSMTTTIKLTAADLQPDVSAAFPIEVEQSAIKVQLSNPRLRMDQGADKLALDADVTVKLPNIGLRAGKGEGIALPPLTGKTSVEGDIVYNKATGTVSFAEGEMTEFKVDQLPESFQAQVKAIASTAASKQLKKIDLYTLSEAKLEEKAARSLVQSVAVKNGKLEITVGLSSD